MGTVTYMPVPKKLNRSLDSRTILQKDLDRLVMTSGSIRLYRVPHPDAGDRDNFQLADCETKPNARSLTTRQKWARSACQPVQVSYCLIRWLSRSLSAQDPPTSIFRVALVVSLRETRKGLISQSNSMKGSSLLYELKNWRLRRLWVRNWLRIFPVYPKFVLEMLTQRIQAAWYDPQNVFIL